MKKFIVLAAVLCIGSSLFAYSGGDGSAGNPYQIANVADFQQITATSGDWSKSFILTADIDLTGLTYTQAPIAPHISGDGDFQGMQFTGVFDGNGHIIFNLTINQPTKWYIGLFGYVGSSGKFRNLGLENVNVTGGFFVGGLVGWNEGTLTECYATGSFSGTGYVGGLVGRNDGILTKCYATSLVSGASDNSFSGGLVGRNDGTLTECYATGSVSGNQYVGGLVGSNGSHDAAYGTITSCYAAVSVNGIGSGVGGLVGNNEYFCTLTDCYATGSVSGIYRQVGGLVGSSNGLLISCYATGSVTANNSSNESVGGLVGETGYGSITSCYATGSVVGKSRVGGLVGSTYQCSLISCYATGSVAGTVNSSSIGGLVGRHDGSIVFCYSTGSVRGNYNIGGLVGYNIGTITDCFWDKQTSGTIIGVGYGASTGVTRKSTVEMKTMSTFTNAGWDFVDTWWMPVGDYPHLISLSGTFTLSIQANPSFITSVTPSIGQHTVFGAVNISAKRFSQCPDVYQFDHWEGEVDDPGSENTTVFMDSNKVITAVFTLGTPVCGDDCHPNFTVGDLNHDCMIDLADFAILSSRWMNCTKPECD